MKTWHMIAVLTLGTTILIFSKSDFRAKDQVTNGVETTDEMESDVNEMEISSKEDVRPARPSTGEQEKTISKEDAAEESDSSEQMLSNSEKDAKAEKLANKIREKIVSTVTTEPTTDSVGKFWESLGVKAYLKHAGHPETGLRKEVLGEIENDSAVRLAYSSFYVTENGEEFDKIYVGFEKDDSSYYQLIDDLKNEEGLEVESEMEKENFHRFLLSDGTHIFIDKAYNHEGEIITLIGREFAIH